MKEYLTIKTYEMYMDTRLNEWAAKGWTPEFITPYKDNKVLLTFSKEKEEKSE